MDFGEIVALEFLAGDASAEQQREIFAQYDHALAVDMESAGVARAMHRARSSVHYGPVWIGLRGISDRTAASLEAEKALGSDNDAERSEWRDYAAAAAARVALLLVERLLSRSRPPEVADPGAPAWSK
jgi:nucleoside phosphorylase